MKVRSTPIEGLQVFELDPHSDSRGVFVEGFSSLSLAALGIRFEVKMMNLSLNRKAGTVRGMHWQAEPASQGKIVQAAAGSFFDVAVDLRPGSATFGKWWGLFLIPQEVALYVPRGMAHGCQALVDNSMLIYLTDGIYKPSHERGVRFNDPEIGINWPLPPIEISGRDAGWPMLSELERKGSR